jgi:cysteine desulfurase
LHTCQWLEQQGYQLTTLDVNEEGFVDLDQLRDSITDQTFMVSIQHGNQEVGTIQSIDEISKICKEKNVLYHTDAALSFTQMDLDVTKIQADLVTLSGHKIHGPKGVGALYVRHGTGLKKIFHGGYSENDMRPGTENVAGAVGFGKAVKLARPDDIASVRSMQKKLLQSLTQDLDGVLVNGPKDLDKRLPGNVNVSFDLIEGESVVLHLDMRGISVITGSACFSRSLEPSYVMMGLGFTHERSHGSIRFTLSRFNRMEEIDRVISVCREVVEALRKISPLKNKE